MADSRGLSLLRVPVRIDPSFLLVAVFFGWSAARTLPSLALWVAIMLVSVLLHEMGHAMAFRAFGYLSSVQLFAMGGLTTPETDRPLRPGADVVVSLAGPLVGILIGGIVLALRRSGGLELTSVLARQAAVDVIFVNLGWGILNLAPMLPLDGGRVMASVLNLATRGHGERPAYIVSIATAVVAGLAALWFGQPFVLLLLAFLAANSVKALRQSRPAPRPADHEIWLADGRQALGQGALLAASNRAREVLGGARDPATRAGAARLLVWAALLDGRTDDAVDVMRTLPTDGPVLDDAAVTATGGRPAAVEVLQRTFAARPGGTTGSFLARALVESDQLDAAVALVTGRGSEVVGMDARAIVGAALFRAGRLEEAADLGERSFESHPHPVLAYNVACTRARLGQPDRALSWLSRAADLGYADLRVVDTDPDLAAVRSLPGYEQVRRRMAPGTTSP